MIPKPIKRFIRYYYVLRKRNLDYYKDQPKAKFDDSAGIPIFLMFYITLIFLWVLTTRN